METTCCPACGKNDCACLSLMLADCPFCGAPDPSIENFGDCQPPPSPFFAVVRCASCNAEGPDFTGGPHVMGAVLVWNSRSLRPEQLTGWLRGHERDDGVRSPLSPGLSAAPCPFCSNAVIGFDRFRGGMSCGNCRCLGPIATFDRKPSEEEALELWNKRKAAAR